jgi:hypothetical protein
MVKIPGHIDIKFSVHNTFLEKPSSNTLKAKLFESQIQSNLTYVTFQGNSEIWSHKTGGRLIQV